MMRSKTFVKNLVSIFMFAAISFFSAKVISAQCEGIYFKLTGRTITDSQVYIYDFNEQFAADVNGDGKLDLVATNINSPVNFNKLFIYPGDGAGGFGARTEINLPGALYREYSYYLEDFNRDNKIDLFVRYASGVLVYLNNGAGAFTPLTPTALSGEEVQNIADLNNDMRLDLITTGPSNTFYRLANADGTFGTPVQLPSPNYSGRHEGDFDGDGDIDFATVDYSGATNALRIIVNQGNGTFTVSSPLIFLDSGGFFLDAVRDFNNDGKPDLIFTGDSNTPKIAVVLNQGNNNFTKTTYNVAPSVNRFFTEIADYNGDGFIDFINPTTQVGALAAGYLVSLNNGAGAFTQHSYTFGSYLYQRAGDFNGDGKADFIRTYNASRDPGFATPSIFNETRFAVYTNVCNKFGQPKIVDLTGDRKTDMTHWRASDGRWRYHSGPPGNFTGTFFLGASNDRPVPGDYDGDGLTDYAVFRSDGFWYARNSSDNSLTTVHFGLDTDKPLPADYNGDGRTDFAVYRPSNGAWYFLMSGTNQFSSQYFGVAGDVPVPEDYDGDERADIAVFRPGTGIWYVLRSSDNSFYGVQWGLSTDDPHPGDYDGDGKADLCVRRKSNNYWYILRSYNNQSGAIPFGLAEDIAQTGDWDANGNMDIGVYRPSTRFWYASNSNLGVFGEAGDIPVASIQR